MRLLKPRTRGAQGAPGGLRPTPGVPCPWKGLQGTGSSPRENFPRCSLVGVHRHFNDLKNELSSSSARRSADPEQERPEGLPWTPHSSGKSIKPSHKIVFTSCENLFWLFTAMGVLEFRSLAGAGVPSDLGTRTDPPRLVGFFGLVFFFLNINFCSVLCFFCHRVATWRMRRCL